MLSSVIFSGFEKAGCDSARARAAKVASEEEEEEGVEVDGGIADTGLGFNDLKPPASVTCGTNLGLLCLLASASIRRCARSRAGVPAGGTSQKE